MGKILRNNGQNKQKSYRHSTYLLNKQTSKQIWLAEGHWENILTGRQFSRENWGERLFQCFVGLVKVWALYLQGDLNQVWKWELEPRIGTKWGFKTVVSEFSLNTKFDGKPDIPISVLLVLKQPHQSHWLLLVQINVINMNVQNMFYQCNKHHFYLFHVLGVLHEV